MKKPRLQSGLRQRKQELTMSESHVITDPRERLLTVGNQILEAIYQLAATEEWQKNAERAAKSEDKSEINNIMAADGVEKIVARLGEISKLDRAKAEYITLRSTIEALTGGTR